MLKKTLLFLLLLGLYSNSFAATNILVFGDSLSAGYGIDIQQGWVTLLQQQLAKTHPTIKIINASISGNTTTEGVTRLSATLARNKPDILILELGANDGLRGIPLIATRGNLAKMIAAAKKQSIKILLVGLRLPPNYGPVYTKRFQQIYTDLAKQYKVAVVPQLLAGVDDNLGLVQADGMHPTAQAQPILVKNVWKVLQTLL